MHHLSSFIICSHNIFQVRYKTDQQCCGFHPSPQPSGWRLHLTHTFSHKNALKLSIKKYEPLMVYLDRWTTFIISCECLASFFFQGENWCEHVMKHLEYMMRITNYICLEIMNGKICYFHLPCFYFHACLSSEGRQCLWEWLPCS